MDKSEVTQEDIKNSVIIIALDNLIYLCEQALELKELDQNQMEYYSLLKAISQDIITEMGSYINHGVIPRPKWEKVELNQK